MGYGLACVVLFVGGKRWLPKWPMPLIAIGVAAAVSYATGYAPRDYLASPAADALVADPQAFAWNPSGGGFKIEDTVLATATGVEVLSLDREWPGVSYGGRSRPDVLT